MTIELIRVGRERRPVAVIDGFAPDPHALRAAALRARFGPARHLYPGLRAELPDGYWAGVRAVVAEALALIGHVADFDVIDASFSIVATPRADLAIGQRVPHCDARQADRVALVHFLGDGDQGGTAFYRHRSTGFETIDARRGLIYDGQLEAEMRHGGPPPADYVGADDRLFERTALVPAAFDRALIYPSFLLHSGAIPADAALSADPANGRLTVTGFLTAAPAPPAS